MGKREKNLKAATSHREEDQEEREERPAQSNSQIIVSSDDEEANEDLSLKIVEKAMIRAFFAGLKNQAVPDEPGQVDVINISSSSLEEAEDVAKDVKGKTRSTRENGKKNKEKKGMKVEKPEEAVVLTKEKEKAETSNETSNGAEIEPAETSTAQITDNVVLRKLLRGPRYFDPPDSGWGTCYNCGEEGHTTVNCTLAKRRKPCYVCGSLEHNAKQCIKGRECFVCKKGGHRAKDCPEKYKRGLQNSNVCLRCGDSGHDMFSCQNGYLSEDLKEMQCYICKSFGHLCCADFSDAGPIERTCYSCGQLGHCGLECMRLRGETSGFNSLGLCFKCGEGGHFARECTSSAKVRKRNLKLSTPTKKFSKENGDHFRVRSAPSDLGKARKRRKSQYEEAVSTTPFNSKQRRGWITEDPGDLPHGKAKTRGWGSPVTPTYKKNTTYSSVAAGHTSSSYSLRKSQEHHFRASPSNTSSNFYQHRYSASRFGNSNSDRTCPTYYW